MAVLVAIALFLILIVILYYISSNNFGYWKKKKVPFAKPIPLFGNYAEYILQRKYYPEVCRELCQQFPDEPYFGTFYGTEPALVIQDPEIIKLVLNKDFYYFNSRELMEYTKKELITQNLFFTHGDKWKVVRQNLTPLFTSGKMKGMFYLIEKCAFMLEDMLDYETSISSEVPVRAIAVKYTMDCICSCAFGVESNTQARDSENNPFSIMGLLIFGRSRLRGFKNVFRWMWPKMFYGLGMKSFPVEIDDFFFKLLTGVFQSRQYKPSPRNDFVDLVLNLKNNKFLVGDSISNLKTGGNKKIELEVTDELMVSQCVVFFAAGFETSAGYISLTMFELAKDQEAQKRAQKEVDEYLERHNNKLNFDCVNELPFVYACVSEALRMYPILGILTREVVEDYTFPTGLKVEKGMRVHLPVHHIHHDPRNFPEPEKYIPERFMSGSKHEIKPYTYFPFGEGPRTCIGKY